jgi:hypothetical protein
MNKKELVEKLSRELNLKIHYWLFVKWEFLKLINEHHLGVYVGRKVKIYTEKDYKKIKEKIIDLIKKGKIRPKKLETLKISDEKKCQ